MTVINNIENTDKKTMYIGNYGCQMNAFYTMSFWPCKYLANDKKEITAIFIRVWL